MGRVAIARQIPLALFTTLSPAVTTKVYDTYWYFAAERQNIFFKKLSGEAQAWTDDPILQKYKFTNSFRASDRVSQYLIKNVIYKGDQSFDEVFFRTIFFKIFNKIETWEALEGVLGPIEFRSFEFERYDKALLDIKQVGPIFSAAYIMPSGKTSFGYTAKHRNCLMLLKLLMDDNVPFLVAESRSLRQVFDILRSYPLLGDFLAYQFTIDLNYTNIIDFPESEFVIPGPGARNGIRKVFSDFGGLSEADLIRLVADRQEIEFANRGIEFKTLWGRRLQYIDCQNLFCEVDKYSRVAHPEISDLAGRKRIKQKYMQKVPTSINYWYPPKWGLNDLITGGTSVLF
jgi:hypothetical protein